MPKHALSGIQDEYYSPKTNWADTICPNPECGSDDINYVHINYANGHMDTTNATNAERDFEMITICPSLTVSKTKLYPTMSELDKINLDRICPIARARGFKGCEGYKGRI